MVPIAHVSHRTPERMRIRIPLRKGDADYFARLEKSLTDRFNFQKLTVNHLTGSILIVDPSIDPAAVADHGRENELFDLQVLQPPREALARKVSSPVAALNRSIERFSGGDVDAAGLVFIALCVYGVIEIARGNLRRPPWYTALWYAFGVFTKSIVDRAEKNVP
jgi:hypothetical protein